MRTDPDSEPPRPKPRRNAQAEILERLFSPPWWTWDPPGAATAAWLATHVTAVVIFAATVFGATWAQPWRQACCVGWIAVSSRLATRALLSLLHRPARIAAQQWWRRPGRMGGPYLAASFATLIACTSLGRSSSAAYAGAFALTVGGRIAGIDCWEGSVRPPGYYARTVASAKGVVSIVMALAVTALCIGLAAVFIDPLVIHDAGGGQREFLWTFSRRRQFVTVTVALLVLLPPIVAICEAIAAVGRFHKRLEERLAASERLNQRVHISDVLHDSVLSLTRHLGASIEDPEQRRLLVTLEVSLRALRIDYAEHRHTRDVRSCCRRAFELANDFGLQIHLSADAPALATTLAPDAAAAFERTLLVLVGNSGGARAAEAQVAIEVATGVLDLIYSDDAGSFDGEAALERHGGLRDVADLIADIGGHFRMDDDDRTTISRARLPL